MTAKSFASIEDTAEKKVSFDQIETGLYACPAEVIWTAERDREIWAALQG